MNIKKKIIVGVAASAFAFATMFNMTLFQDNDHSAIALEQATIMAQANLGEWMSDTFGGNWKATDYRCDIDGTRNVHESSCSINIARYGASAYCNCTTSEERYEITYYVSKCNNGHGDCWVSQNC